MIGKYKLIKDIQARVGITVFTSPKGMVVEVKQEDKENRKVLIDFGDGFIDWFHESWIGKYTEVA